MRTPAERPEGNAPGRVSQLLLVLLLAFAAFIQLTVVSRTVVEYPLRADAGEYFSYAWNLKHFGVYSSTHPKLGGPEAPLPTPDKIRSPGYPLFLLAVGSPQPSEDYLRRVAFVQAGLGIASVLLAYLIAASFLSRAWAFLAGLLTAASPHLAMTSTYVLSESPFTFLLLSSAWLTIRAAKSAQPRTAALAGVLWGACALVRPTVLLLPAIFLLLAFALPRLRVLRKSSSVLLLCFAAVMAPWAIRNVGVEQSGPSLMVSSMAHGAYPNLMYRDRPETFGFPYRFDPEYSAHVQSLGTLLTHLRGRFAAEPLRYGSWFALGKPYFFLSLEDAQSLDIQIYPTPANPYYENLLFAWIRVLSIDAHWPLMLGGLIGIAVVGWRSRQMLPATQQIWLPAAIVALVVVYAIGIHMIFAPFPRYAIPFRPLIYALAMVPVQAAWSAWRGRLAA